MKTKILFLLIVLAVFALVVFLPDKTEDPIGATLPGRVIAHLPDPTTNNAVSGITLGEKPYLYSFSGLGEGLGREDIHSLAFKVDVEEQFATEIPGVPGGKNRLASIAAAARGEIYLFGGYTVDENGEEVSTAEVFAFDPKTETYKVKAPIPTPVDDTVALVYQDRFIYLVSGWHNDGNVKAVQVYDTLEDSWFSATDYPGVPVFGHGGGISGNRFVIADGVAVLGRDGEGRNRFGAVEEAWLGAIDPKNPANISWERLPPHPGNPLYRMAAAGVPGQNLVVFAGGSDNPYNYNGIGYNSVPSQPSATVFGYDIVQKQWLVYGEKPYPSMDHRGLVYLGERFYTLGGMGRDQEVIDTVSWFTLGRDYEQ